MASTYTTDLRIEKMANGENSGTWGTKTNTSWDLIEQAIAGVASVAMTDAEYTLSTANAASDEARNAVITMTGTLTGAQNVIVPSVDKCYTIKNSTTGGYSIVVKTAAGTGITILNGETEQLYCDATNVLRAQTTPTGTGAPVRASQPSLTTTLGVGGAAASSSGAGISFPATQSASTDANTLDDYEEGTFTPTVDGTVSAGAGTYTIQSGEYTKIGNVVIVRIGLSWSAHTGSGNMQISGLPFTSGSAGIVPCAIYQNSMSYTSGHVIYAYVAASATTITIASIPAGGGSPASVTLDTSASFFVSAIYRI